MLGRVNGTDRTASEQAEVALARAHGTGQELGAFITVLDSYATEAAARVDARIAAGEDLPLAGMPVAIKDNLCMSGIRTTAASKMLTDFHPPHTATVVERLEAAGAVPVGKTNLDEFAMGSSNESSAFGPVRNPHDHSRVPGGSSGGSAAAVAAGIVPVALGTDTGGSCRIPAACCNVVGYKPTARRIPRDGLVPLSTSLDSVGPFATSVADCAIVDAIYAGETPAAPVPANLAGLRIAVPQTLVLDDMDAVVARGFESACTALAAAGARLTNIPLSELRNIQEANAKGGFAAAEATHWHRRLLAERAGGYDPRVSVRIAVGARMTASDYLDVLEARARLIAATDAATAEFDILALPTMPTVPATIAAATASDADYRRINLTMLGNCNWVNFLDRCAIAMPCGEAGGPPVSLMLVGHRMGDARLFAIAAAVEALLAAR